MNMFLARIDAAAGKLLSPALRSGKCGPDRPKSRTTKTSKTTKKNGIFEVFEVFAVGI